jgi:hypothetical protein
MRTSTLRSNLPGLLTISLSLLVLGLELLFRLDLLRTYQLRIGRFNTEVALNVGYLLMLPLIGCSGSFAAKRLGEPRPSAIRAVLSPVALVSAMLLGLLVMDIITARALLDSLEYSSGIIVGWVLIPAAALLVGGLAGWNFPFAREKARG